MTIAIGQRIPQPLNRWTVRFGISGLVLSVAAAVMYFSVASQPTRRFKITEIVGQTDAGSVLVEQKNSTVGSEVVSGQQITTQPTSKVGLQENSVTTARLGKESALSVDGNCLQLNQGNAILSNTQGCLGAVVVSGDGIYTLERLGSLGEIKVLSGQIKVAIPSNPAIAAIPLQANQKITLSLAGDEVGPIRLMLPTEVDQILKGELFQAFQVPLAKQTQIAGLQPPPVQPVPVKPAPVKPAPAKPAPHPAPPASHPAPVSTSQTNDDDRISYADDTDSATNDAQSSASYSRYFRRKRSQPVSDRPVYRRRWRSSYNYASRRPAPAYNEPTPNHPAPVETPAPVEPSPHPVDPAPELPPPFVSVPPPVLVEPPMEKPPIP
jgi:hypothetical protein